MENSLNEIFSAKNEMVKKGQIVEATEKFFASNAKSIDFDGTITNDKTAMLQKMQGFAGAIAKVNVTVNDGKGLENFEITNVSLHNYNNGGYCLLRLPIKKE